MSEFQVVVVEIGKVDNHPNADTLSITNVLGSYPVVFRTGDFHPGDLAIYVPVDAVVPQDERFAFLGKSNRIKARKLRGIFSMGLLVPISEGMKAGDNVQYQLGITKHEEQWVRAYEHGTCAKPPAINWPVYDLEAYRKNPHVLKPGEMVAVTEKIHGCNGRWTYQDGELHCGSHRQWKAGDSLWSLIAKQYDLETKLKEYPGLTLYGEVYGGKIQDLRYGLHFNEYRLAVFDARLPSSAWLNINELTSLCNSVNMNLPMVPILQVAPWTTDMLALAEGKTTMSGANHVREGIVIQPVVERFDHIGRVKLKHVGEGYYLRSQRT